MREILVRTSAYTRPPARGRGRTASGGRNVRATRVFLAGNHISDEQRDKEQERAGEKWRRIWEI